MPKLHHTAQPAGSSKLCRHHCLRTALGGAQADVWEPARLSGPVTVGDWFLTLEKNASDVKSSIISILQMRKPKLSWSSAIQWASDRFGIGSHPFSVWARVPSISSLGPKSMWRCISQMEQTWVAGWVEFFGKGRQWELCCRDFMMEGLRGQALESRLDVVGKGLGT